MCSRIGYAAWLNRCSESWSIGAPWRMPMWSLCAPIATHSFLSFGSCPGYAATTLRAGAGVSTNLTLKLTVLPAVPVALTRLHCGADLRVRELVRDRYGSRRRASHRVTAAEATASAATAAAESTASAATAGRRAIRDDLALHLLGREAAGRVALHAAVDDRRIADRTDVSASGGDEVRARVERDASRADRRRRIE